MNKDHHNDYSINFDEPIFALASGHPTSAIAIIRVSGKNCHDLIKQTLTSKSQFKDRTNIYTKFIDPDSSLTIDDVVVCFYSSPHSYTGQDSVEINCHGGSYIIQSIMKVLQGLGLRMAEPGEFTKRAYLNGKMDLSSAEGVRELINAQSHEQWQAARQLSSGQLRDEIETLRDLLLNVSSHLEARIDFPDEQETSALPLKPVTDNVSKAKDQIKTLLSTFESGKVARNGLKVSLIGPPNVGKSTLMNTLLQKERAIVTATPGTTRDYIEETCMINGTLINLIDTAGIRENAHEIENLGIQYSLDLINNSDLVLFLVSTDLSDSVSSLLKEVINKQASNSHLKILTKVDLEPTKASLPEFEDYIKISSKTNEGIDELKKRISSISKSYTDRLNEATCISSHRHFASLNSALSFLNNYLDSEKNGELDECLAFEIQEALRSLRSIIGEVSTNDILDRIFSEFCLGK